MKLNEITVKLKKFEILKKKSYVVFYKIYFPTCLYRKFKFINLSYLII